MSESIQLLIMNLYLVCRLSPFELTMFSKTHCCGGIFAFNSYVTSMGFTNAGSITENRA